MAIGLLQNCSDVLRERREHLGAEAIFLGLGFSNKISHRSRAEFSDEAENRAFLNDSRRMP